MHRICHVVCHDASLISHLTKFYVYLHCYLLKCKTSLSVNCSDHTIILLIVSLYHHSCFDRTRTINNRVSSIMQAPASNNLIGPKPFGGSSTISSPPLANTGNSTLPRPQSQTVTGKFLSS